MMSVVPSADHDVRRRWARWAMLALERLPVPYPLVAALVGLMAVVEQALEYWLAVRAGSLAPNPLDQATVFIVLFLYILASLRILKWAALKALLELRPSVLISDEEYDRHVYRMVNAEWGVELGLLLFSVVVVILLFWVQHSDLMILASGLPSSFPLAIFMSLVYVLLGWLVLSLVYASIRQARAMGALARSKLAVNVFDPSNLLPFGRLSVWHGLAIVGLVMVPLLVLGMPKMAGFLVVGFSVIGLLAVFIPLWGVHEQMGDAKTRALTAMSQQLLDLQTRWLAQTDHSTDEQRRMMDKSNMLLTLRKVVSDSPNWPFRSEAAVLRAIVATASPLIYFFLNQLILKYVFPLFAR